MNAIIIIVVVVVVIDINTYKKLFPQVLHSPLP